MVIWKHEIGFGPTTIRIPQGATILDAQVQYDKIVIWTLVDPDRERSERTFAVAGTGHHLDWGDGKAMRHISTVQMAGGTLVWHVFEIVPADSAGELDP